MEISFALHMMCIFFVKNVISIWFCYFVLNLCILCIRSFLSSQLGYVIRNSLRRGGWWGLSCLSFPPLFSFFFPSFFSFVPFLSFPLYLLLLLSCFLYSCFPFPFLLSFLFIPFLSFLLYLLFSCFVPPPHLPSPPNFLLSQCSRKKCFLFILQIHLKLFVSAVKRIPTTNCKS